MLFVCNGRELLYFPSETILIIRLSGTAEIFFHHPLCSLSASKLNTRKQFQYLSGNPKKVIPAPSQVTAKKPFQQPSGNPKKVIPAPVK
ncbi:hypothetical protein CHS0354_029024 [Potamilus streckersoni]|uniref:Uncharacterized protein n=1 Tax=Potamilus streckersoni TaxID=2493646 RepID=A0AAE0SGR7_9BIVA|nr:hypothetical protein CHS0354_029024 [Potamilus streckersoni]